MGTQPNPNTQIIPYYMHRDYQRRRYNSSNSSHHYHTPPPNNQPPPSGIDDTQQIRDHLKDITPKMIFALTGLLGTDDTRPELKVRICEILLELGWGKEKEDFKVNNNRESIKDILNDLVDKAKHQ